MPFFDWRTLQHSIYLVDSKPARTTSASHTQTTAVVGLKDWANALYDGGGSVVGLETSANAYYDRVRKCRFRAIGVKDFYMTELKNLAIAF